MTNPMMYAAGAFLTLGAIALFGMGYNRRALSQSSEPSLA
jgi:hypothetical protein